MPNANKDAKKEHFEERITLKTKFFDHDKVADITSDLPHTLPDLETFERSMRELQVSKNDKIVCYDNVGIFSSPRAAWMLRYFGASNVRVLDGGIRKWKAENRFTVSGAEEFHENIMPDFHFAIPDPE